MGVAVLGVFFNKNKALKYKDLFWCAVIVTYSMNTFLGSLLLLCVSPYIIYQIFNKKFDKLFFVSIYFLISFCVLFAVMMYGYGLEKDLLGIIRIIYYPFCLYVLGNTLAKNDFLYKKTYRYLYLIIGSSALYGFLSLYKTIKLYGSMNDALSAEGRTVVNLWGDNLIAATGLNSYISLGLSLLPLLFLSDKSINNKKFKIINIILFSISVYTTVQLANRTGLMITIVSTIAVILFTKKNVKFSIKLIMATILLFFFKLLYSQNFMGVKNWWESSLIYYRLENGALANDNPRILAWKTAFNGLFEYPMGGRQSYIRVGYAHNLWLDVARDTGIIPYLLIISFTIAVIITLVKFMRTDHPAYLKGLIVTSSISFFITFSIEPVIEGILDYFTFFCFFIGVIQRLNVDYKKELVPVNHTRTSISTRNILDKKTS